MRTEDFGRRSAHVFRIIEYGLTRSSARDVEHVDSRTADRDTALCGRRRLVPRGEHEQVDVAGDVSERPQKERHLAAMMHAMVGGVMQELPDRHDLLRPATEGELDGPGEVLVCQSGKKVTDVMLYLPRRAHD